MRHFQPRARAIAQLVSEIAHIALRQSQTIDSAVFLRTLHQRLHADTDRQHRAGLHRLGDHPADIEPVDFGHAIANRADAWKDDPVRLRDRFRVRGDRHVDIEIEFAADMLHRLGDGMQIAHTVVDDRDRTHLSNSAVSGAPPDRSGAETQPTSCPWWMESRLLSAGRVPPPCARRDRMP